MTDARIRASIEAYIAAWNEHDDMQRMRLIEQACAEDLLMRTSGARINGRSQLDVRRGRATPPAVSGAIGRVPAR
jgi:hypothetical protein